MIWGDDIGWFNLSAYNRGMMGYRTPNIDGIACFALRSSSGIARSAESTKGLKAALEEWQYQGASTILFGGRDSTLLGTLHRD